MLSERGIFWWSDTTFQENQFAPESNIPGVLNIGESGRINIKLEGELPKHKQLKGVEDENDTPRRPGIAGFLHSGERYILAEGNFRGERTFKTAGVNIESWVSLYCVVGHAPLPAKANVKSIFMDMAGYEEWLRLGRLHKTKTKRLLTFTHDIQPDLRFSTEAGTLSFQRDAHLSQEGRFGTAGSTFKERARVKFSPKKAVGLEGAVRLHGHFQDLLILLTNSEYQMPQPSVKLTTGQSGLLYFGRSKGSETPPSFRDWVAYFDSFAPNLGRLWFTWLEAREKLDAAAYLYLATRRGLEFYDEHRFLNLVMGLEAFHRIKFGEPDLTGFTTRLQAVIDQIADPRDKLWVRKKLRHLGGPSLEERLCTLLADVPFPLKPKELRQFLAVCSKARNDIAHFGHSTAARKAGAPVEWLSVRSAIVGHLYHAKLLVEIGVQDNLILNWLNGSHLNFYLRKAGFKVPQPSLTTG